MENKVVIWKTRLNILRGREKDNGRICAKLERKIRNAEKVGEN
jgi:hypothetical protein